MLPLIAYITKSAILDGFKNVLPMIPHTQWRKRVRVEKTACPRPPFMLTQITVRPHLTSPQHSGKSGSQLGLRSPNRQQDKHNPTPRLGPQACVKITRQ